MGNTFYVGVPFSVITACRTLKQGAVMKKAWSKAAPILLTALIASTMLSCVGTKLTKKSWSEAFHLMHSDLSKKYPFTEHKKIDWDARYAETAPMVKEAEERQDKELYHRALKTYAVEVNDMHFGLEGDDFGQVESNIGGCYGFGIIRLDDGRYIAHVILPEKPADRAGMIWGAEITHFNGVAVDDAVRNTALFWYKRSMPTIEGRFLNQCRMLPRAPAGTEASVTFINPGETKAVTAKLIAEDDDFRQLELASLGQVNAIPVIKSPIKSKMISKGIGYIQIIRMMPNFGNIRLHAKFKRVLKKLMNKGAESIIIDVRGNEGGLDKLAAQIAGHFYMDDAIYEYVSRYSPESGSFEIIPDDTITITPDTPRFTGKVVVLVDLLTISASEGIPMALGKLDNCTVIGQHGTNGSFGVSNFGTIYRLPEKQYIIFFEGRSLDENKEIQVDSDWTGKGGIEPDIRVPMTYENVRAQYKDGKDVILNAAVDYLSGK